MKNLFKFLSLAVAVLCLTTNSFADGFNKIHTSDGLYIIAVGNGGNIFRSVNGGDTWAKYTESTVNFKSVYTEGNDVWLASDDGKVYKSTKQTTALTPYSTGVTSSINSINFVNTNLGFACGDNGVMMKTVTGGTVWVPSNTGIAAGVKLNSVDFKDATNGVTVGDNGKVYITNDAGTTWTPQTVATTRNLLDAKYMSDGIAVVGEWGTLLTYNGTWSAVNTRINTDIRGVSGTSMSDVHVAGGGGFIRNNKNGSTNFLNFEINPMLANLVDICYFNSTLGFAVSSMNNAIIRTVNSGATWTLPTGTSTSIAWQQKSGASGNCLGDNLCVHPTERNTIFTCFSGRVYVSRNRGESWSQIGTQIPSGNTPHSFYVSSVDTNVFMCAIESSPDKVARSTDYGQTWNTVIGMDFSNYGEPLQMDQNDNHVFYFGPDGGGFYKSTDNGATFSEISNFFSFRSPCDIMVTYDEPNTIFLADGNTNGSGGTADLFKSVNGGLNWTNIFENPSNEIPNMGNTVFDNKVLWFTNWSGGQIFHSTNAGLNISLNHSNSFSGWGMDICKEDPNFIMTGSWSAGSSALSTDGGLTWRTVNGMSGSGGVMKLVERGYSVGVGGSNAYKLNVQYTVITSVGETNISSVPKDFNLSQNYPNPFNPSTKINFDLPKSGNVTLKVYNELGREVNTLVNSFRNAGSYEITFDASSLTSGIYFYKLSFDGMVSTKKMLLVK